MYPVSGGFYTLVTRFVDASWGFAMGWNYVSTSVYYDSCSQLIISSGSTPQVFQWAVVLPLEVSRLALT